MPQRSQLDSSTTFWSSSSRLRLGSALLVMLLIVALPACGGATSTPSASGGQNPTSTSTTAAATSTTVPATSPPATATSVSTPTPAASPASTPTASPSAGTLTVNVYFMRQDKLGVAHRTVPRTQQVGAAAIQELLKGPSADEKSAGLSTSIPSGTKYLGLTIANKIATVNLSSEYESGGGSLSIASRLAQVVFTLTQFSSIEQVNFLLDGKAVTVFSGEGLVMDHPVGRSNYEQLTPAILVETPAVGDTITAPVRLTGSANTFEAAFVIDILDANGKLLQEQHAQATSGTGTRGTFDVSVPFKVDQKQPGKVVVFELSAKDGSKTNIVEIPVTLSP